MSLTLLLNDDHMLDGTEKKLKWLSSIGRETNIAKIRIMDDGGSILPTGEFGEIVVRSGHEGVLEKSGGDGGDAPGRIGRPFDPAYAIAFLASPKSEFVTGQCLSVSGGFSMVS